MKILGILALAFSQAALTTAAFASDPIDQQFMSFLSGSTTTMGGGGGVAVEATDTLTCLETQAPGLAVYLKYDCTNSAGKTVDGDLAQKLFEKLSAPAQKENSGKGGVRKTGVMHCVASTIAAPGQPPVTSYRCW